MTNHSSIILLGGLAIALGGVLQAEDAWWNPAWTQRQKITLDTGTGAAALSESAGSATVLVRLSDGNFQFAGAREDGSDLRFIAADGKTVLAHQIERYDNLLNEAFVWVRLPEVKPVAKESFHVYFGNADAAMPAPNKPAEAFDADTALVYHFAERASAPVDATANGNNAAGSGATAGDSIIGSGLRLLGSAPISIPDSKSLEWKSGQALTIAAWIKPGAPLAAGTWSHLALVAEGKTLRLFLNGMPYASIDGQLPALSTPIMLGGLATEASGTSLFTGDLDEFSISAIARSTAWIQLAAVNQGNNEAAQRVLSLGTLEGEGTEEQSKFMEHLSLFRDIAGNMMFDGWIAVGICAVMIVIGWTVAIRKFIYLNSIEKGTKVFLKRWQSLSTDLTALDPDDTSSVSSLGGQIDPADQGPDRKVPVVPYLSDRIRGNPPSSRQGQQPRPGTRRSFHPGHPRQPRCRARP
ncbi:MAG: DUF2341 domain-containing protein [Verrucomicrobia bacterium]|nr:DUF2341 domain-containing protein [Verrucomicrobiota bacterium]